MNRLQIDAGPAPQPLVERQPELSHVRVTDVDPFCRARLDKFASTLQRELEKYQEQGQDMDYLLEKFMSFAIFKLAMYAFMLIIELPRYGIDAEFGEIMDMQNIMGTIMDAQCRKRRALDHRPVICLLYSPNMQYMPVDSIFHNVLQEEYLDRRDIIRPMIGMSGGGVGGTLFGRYIGIDGVFGPR